MDLRFPDNADIADILSDLNDPASYHGYLRAMSHFSGHSWHNICRIYRQMPHASKLADYNGWNEQYGRKIKQGSTSIKIYMPAGQLPKKKTTGETAAEAPAKYRQCSLFDITQTKGNPIYRLAGDVMSDDSLSGVFAEVLKTMCPSSVGQIDCRDAIGQIVSERFENADSPNDDFIISSIAYVVCRRFGVYVGNITLDIRIDEKTLETIGRQADGIIIDMENRFATACKERGLDPMTLHDPPAEPETTAPPEPPAPPIQPEAPIEPPTLKYLPDASITTSERDRYGYTRPELLPLNRERAMELFLRDTTVYLLHKNNTESIARYISDIQDHPGIFGMTYGAWQNSRECIALSSGDPEARQEAKFIFDGGDAFAIYQTETGDSPGAHRSHGEPEKDGISADRRQYALIYAAPLPDPPSDSPEGIFMWVNAERPEGYNGRALTIGDVLSIKKDGLIASYYANGRTFKELPVFMGEEGRQNRRKTETGAAENAPAAAKQNIAQEKQNHEAAIPAKSEKESDVNFAGYKTLQLPAQTEPPPPPTKTPPPAPPEIQMDIECAEAIAEAIQAHKKSGDRYDLETPAGMLTKKYGRDRMKRVLTGHILSKPKGFHGDALSWAKTCMESDPKSAGETPATPIDTHCAVLDAFANEFRAVLDKKPTFSEKMEDAKKKSHAHNSQKKR